MSDTEQIPQPNLALVAGVDDGWSPTRLGVRGFLADNAPALVVLYEAAVRMLYDERFPARKYLIAHCVREIANGLPWFLGGPVAAPVESPGLSEPIVEPWTEVGL